MSTPALQETARPERAVSDSLRLGPWTLGAPVSLGACGVVFEAKQEGQATAPVAVHVPFARLQSDLAFREEYLAEAASGMATQRRGLCQIIDGGNNGVVWRVMALTEGWTLGALMTRARGRGQGLSPSFALSVCVEAGDILRELSAAGRAHGRLSPSRVILGPEGAVTLCGWTTPNLGPRPSALLNNPTAMAELAPEQIDGINASPLTDVYHLALLLVTVLSRGNPFQRVSAERVQRAILSEELTLPESLPTSLCEVVERSLRRSTLERPTVEDLLNALVEAAAELPPCGPAERIAEVQAITQGQSPQSNPGARAAAASETVALIELLRGPAGKTPVTLLSAAPRRAAVPPVFVPEAPPAPPKTRPQFVIAGALLIVLSMGLGAWMNGQFVAKQPTSPAPPPVAVVEAPVEPVVEVVEASPEEVAAPEEVAVAEAAPTSPGRRSEPSRSRDPEPRERVAPTTPAPAPAPTPPPVTPAVTATVTPAVPPDAPPTAPPSAAPSTLSDLDVSVSGGRLIVRGVVSGAGQKAAGLLVEDDGICEYRIKLSRTDLAAGIGSMPVASPLARRLNVSAQGGNTTITLVCTPGAGQPQLSASPTGFTLTFLSS